MGVGILSADERRFFKLCRYPSMGEPAKQRLAGQSKKSVS